MKSEGEVSLTASTAAGIRESRTPLDVALGNPTTPSIVTLRAFGRFTSAFICLFAAFEEGARSAEFPTRLLHQTHQRFLNDSTG